MTLRGDQMQNVQKNVYFLAQEERFKRRIDLNATFLSVGLQNSAIRYNYPPHRQEEFEFIFIIDGIIRYFCDEEEFEVKAGDAYFISPGQIHEEHSISEPISFYYLKFNLFDYKGQQINRLTNDLSKQVFHDIGSHVKTLFEKVYLESSNKFLGYQQIVENTIIEILINIERYLGPEFSKHSIQKNIDSVVFTIRDEIQNNVGKNYTLDELSDKYAINKFYLIRAFKKNTGESIIEFITKVKMLDAQRQLSNTNNSIKSISYSLGYQNQYYFSRVFKAYFKMTPKQFRQSLITHIIEEKSKPIEQYLNPILLSRNKILYVNYPSEIKDLLFDFRHKAKSEIQTNEVSFVGKDANQILSTTASFEINQETFMIASIKDSNQFSKLVLLKKDTGFLYHVEEDLNIFNVNYPHLAMIHNQYVLEGVLRIDENNKQSCLYVGPNLKSLELKVVFPPFIKSVRVFEYSNKIHAFYTVSGQNYGTGKIAHAAYNSFDEMKQSSFNNIQVFSNHFISGESGGINDIHILQNGLIGIVGHITYTDSYDTEHSYPCAFAFNIDNNKSTKLKIILEKSSLNLSSTKKYFTDKIHTSGLIRRANNRASLYIETDQKIYSIIFDDPFVEFEYGSYKV